jgi:hypothetical protein
VASSRVEIAGIWEKIADHSSKLEKLLTGESSKYSSSIPNVHEQGVLKNLLPSLVAADRVAFGKEFILSGISSDLSNLKSLVIDILQALDVDNVNVMETYFVGKANKCSRKATSQCQVEVRRASSGSYAIKTPAEKESFIVYTIKCT